MVQISEAEIDFEIDEKRNPRFELAIRVGVLMIIFFTFLVSLELMGNAVTQLGSSATCNGNWAWNTPTKPLKCSNKL